MKPLSTVATSMKRSAIREVMELAATVPGAIHLEVGEPDFATPPHIVEAAERALREGWTKYAPNAGIPSLRAAIAEKLRADNGLRAEPEEVVVTPGSVAALNTTVLALLDRGDEVLVPDPGFPNYLGMVHNAGGVPVPYPLHVERGWVPDPDEIAARVTPRTKALMVNSPSNPTGAVYPPAVVAALAELARRHDLYLISDEVYEQIRFEGEHLSPATVAPERTITVNGFSKAYAMTGWRLGYAHAPREIAAVITKLQEPVTSCAVSFVQRAAEAALKGPQDAVARMRDAYRARRDAAVAITHRYDLSRYTPAGAFYLLVDIRPSGLEAAAFARKLLTERAVAVAPGGTFGAMGQGWVRVSLASELGQITEGVERLCALVRGR